MRRVLPLVLVLAACGGPGAGPQISGGSQPDGSVLLPTETATENKPLLGEAPNDLHGVDWRQATLPAEFCGVRELVTLKDGAAKAGSTTWGEVGVSINSSKPAWFGDIDADGRDEAAVSLGCDKGGGTAGQLAFGMVVVRSADGRLELVGEVSATTMRDDAPHVPSLTDVEFQKDAVTVKELWYRPSDADCCPTGASLTRWWLRDGVLKADQAVQVS